MAETTRTKTEALALIPTGQSVPVVSLQDLRDIVASLYDLSLFGVHPVSTDAAVETPEAGTVKVYYSTTQSALAFKDSAGVVHVFTHT
jgi:hypothetical protein